MTQELHAKPQEEEEVLPAPDAEIAGRWQWKSRNTGGARSWTFYTDDESDLIDKMMHEGDGACDFEMAIYGTVYQIVRTEADKEDPHNYGPIQINIATQHQRRMRKWFGPSDIWQG